MDEITRPSWAARLKKREEGAERKGAEGRTKLSWARKLVGPLAEQKGRTKLDRSAASSPEGRRETDEKRPNRLEKLAQIAALCLVRVQQLLPKNRIDKETS